MIASFELLPQTLFSSVSGQTSLQPALEIIVTKNQHLLRVEKVLCTGRLTHTYTADRKSLPADYELLKLCSNLFQDTCTMFKEA